MFKFALTLLTVVKVLANAALISDTYYWWLVAAITSESQMYWLILLTLDLDSWFLVNSWVRLNLLLRGIQLLNHVGNLWNWILDFLLNQLFQFLKSTRTKAFLLITESMARMSHLPRVKPKLLVGLFLDWLWLRLLFHFLLILGKFRLFRLKNLETVVGIWDRTSFNFLFLENFTAWIWFYDDLQLFKVFTQGLDILVTGNLNMVSILVNVVESKLGRNLLEGLFDKIKKCWERLDFTLEDMNFVFKLDFHGIKGCLDDYVFVKKISTEIINKKFFF